jgi:hypothetical protein
MFAQQKLYDTPGVHLHHRQAAVIHADDLPSLAPQSRLKGRCFPVCIFHSLEHRFLPQNFHTNLFLQNMMLCSG